MTSKKRDIVLVGGRGSGKSRTASRRLLTDGIYEQSFFPCLREVQKTTKHSVYRLLQRDIHDLGLGWFYDVRSTSIVGRNGTEFAFLGIRDMNAENIKSLENAKICLVEEAQMISRRSINTLRPTIRESGSQIIWVFNPTNDTDPVYTDYILNPDDDMLILWANWRDNPWFTSESKREMARDYQRDPIEAKHIWEGTLRAHGSRLIVSSQTLRDAMKRELLNEGHFTVGADIAHMGGDRIVFYKRRDNKVVDQYVARIQSTVDTTRDLARFAGGKDIPINIDNGHVGAAVADNLENDGFTAINRIDFGGGAKDPEHFVNTASEMWHEFNAMLPEIDIPNDEELYIELAQRYFIYKGEKIKVESKDDWFKHVNNFKYNSPDKADAMILTFYEPEETGSYGSFAGLNVI